MGPNNYTIIKCLKYNSNRNKKSVLGVLGRHFFNSVMIFKMFSNQGTK